MLPGLRESIARITVRPHFAPLVLAGVACTSLIGLPDLPDMPQGGAASAGGSTAAAGGVPSGGMGATMGGARGGSGGAGASTAAGRSTGGASSGGASNGGTPSSGGTDSNGGTLGAEAGFAGNGDAPAGGSSALGGTAGNANGGTTSGGGGTSATCSPPCAEPNEICKAGACQCATGYTPCGDQCLDLENDRDHCGACDAPCDDGDGCSAGRCFTQLVAIDDNVRIAVDDDQYVYYSLQSTGTVNRVSRTGAVTELANGQYSPQGIAVDANYVYWVTNFDGKVMKRGLASGSPVVTLAKEQGSLVDIAVDANAVYWLAQGTNFPAIRKMDLADGSSPVTLVDTDLANNQRLVIDATHLYWLNSGDTLARQGTIRKVPLTGGELPTTIATIDQPMDLALTGANIYFVSGSTEPGLRRITIGGGEPAQLTSEQSECVAADASGAYVAHTDIFMVSPDGRTKTKLASDPASAVEDIEVHGNEVFWATQKAIRFTSKP